MSDHRRGLVALWRDRQQKLGLYNTAAYWDEKARNYVGLARSNWPSNTYNERVHARQTSLIDALLGDVTGLAVADVGAGTGRISLHLARRGARVHGFDFAPRTLDVARAEAATAALPVVFTEHDVQVPPAPQHVGTFDVALTVGCLALACHDADALERALGHVAALVRPGGRVLLVEPAHAGWALARILRAGPDEWCARAAACGLTLLERRGLLFVPARLALAFGDLPRGLTGRVFAAGEGLLETGRALGLARASEQLADSTAMLFRRGGPSASAPS